MPDLPVVVVGGRASSPAGFCHYRATVWRGARGRLAGLGFCPNVGFLMNANVQSSLFSKSSILSSPTWMPLPTDRFHTKRSIKDGNEKYGNPRTFFRHMQDLHTGRVSSSWIFIKWCMYHVPWFTDRNSKHAICFRKHYRWYIHFLAQIGSIIFLTSSGDWPDCDKLLRW